MLNNTQKKILDYILNIIHENNMPVIVPYYFIADNFNISDMTVKRNIDWLVKNKYIYRELIGNSSIYNNKPIDLTIDFKCYIKNTP